MTKPSDSILDAFEVSIADRNNQFGFDLYAQLIDGKENLLISPASVASCRRGTVRGTARLLN